MAEQPGLDPRHDPIYQRGYDPAVHGGDGGASAPSRRSRRADDDDLFAPPGRRPSAPGEGPAPVTRRERISAPDWTAPPSEGPDGDGGDDPFSILRPEVERSPREPEGAGRVGPDRTQPVPGVASDHAKPWRNPYLVGLVVGGAALAALGFQMFRGALETIYVDFAESGLIYGGNGSSDVDADPVADLVAMQVGWSIGPLLFIAGIAAILSVLVFVAVRWRPAPRGEQSATDAPAGPSRTSSDRQGEPPTVQVDQP